VKGCDIYGQPQLIYFTWLGVHKKLFGIRIKQEFTNQTNCLSIYGGHGTPTTGMSKMVPQLAHS